MLHPALRDAGPEGERLARHSLEEHQQADEPLASVDGKPVDDPRVRRSFRALEANVEAHAAEEAQQVFPSRARTWPRTG